MTARISSLLEKRALIERAYKVQMFYPIYLNLEGKRVVVVGGGEVAERKVAALLESGAAISVISPEITSRLAALAEGKAIDLHQRPYARGDCRGAHLVLSATDDPEISRAVWEEAREERILVNTADQPALCDFIMPAVVRQGDLTVAISTAGTSPALAAKLREKFSGLLGPEYARLLDLLAQARPEIQRRVAGEQDRKALNYRIVDSDIINRLQENDSAGAERRLRQIIEDFVCQHKTP